MRNPSSFSKMIDHFANQTYFFDWVFSSILATFIAFYFIQWTSFGLAQMAFEFMVVARYLFVLRRVRDYFY